jgi:hypothetical protein
MLSTASCQLGFMDAAGLMGPLPDGSFFALLAEHGDRIVRDEDLAECYSERMGRPSIPPSLLARVLLLQYRCGLSDEQAMESVAWDLRWKVRILGDSAYGDQQTREDMQQRGVEVLARVPEGEVREERIGKREFQIDLEAGTVTCPEGHVVAIPQQARRDGERVVNFGAKRSRKN